MTKNFVVICPECGKEFEVDNILDSAIYHGDTKYRRCSECAKKPLSKKLKRKIFGNPLEPNKVDDV